MCEGNHPANYKGCMVYKNLYKAKFPALRTKVLPDTQTRQNSAPRSTDVTYAQAVRNSNIPEQASEIPQNNVNSTPPNDIQELKEMMKSLMQQISTMLNVLTTIVSKISNA